MCYETYRERVLLGNAEDFYDTKNMEYRITEISEKSVKIMLGYEPCFEFLKNVYKETSRNTELVCPFNKKEKYIKEKTCRFKSFNVSNLSTCIILMHGFASKNKKFYFQIGKNLADNGIDSLVYTLPFHFEREEIDGTGISIYKRHLKCGEGKNAGKNNKAFDIRDFRITLELFRQTVIEIRVLIDLLKKTGYDSVGVLGFSFGGFCSSLIACFERNVDFVIPMASMGDFSSLKIFKKGRPGSDKDRSLDEINKFFTENHVGLISPINYTPIIQSERIKLIQGLFDIRAPIKDVMALIKQWGIKRVVWYPCDHFTFFLYNRLTVKIVSDFVKSVFIK